MEPVKYFSKFSISAYFPHTVSVTATLSLGRRRINIFAVILPDYDVDTRRTNNVKYTVTATCLEFNGGTAAICRRALLTGRNAL